MPHKKEEPLSMEEELELKPYKPNGALRITEPIEHLLRTPSAVSHWLDDEDDDCTTRKCQHCPEQFRCKMERYYSYVDACDVSPRW